MTVARAIQTLTGLVCGLITLAVILFLLSANPHNEIVGDIHDAGAWLTTPFHGLFSFKDIQLTVLLNWGLAAVVYAAVGHLLAMQAARTAGGGYRRRRALA